MRRRRLILLADYTGHAPVRAGLNAPPSQIAQARIYRRSALANVRCHYPTPSPLRRRLPFARLPRRGLVSDCPNAASDRRPAVLAHSMRGQGRTGPPCATVSGANVSHEVVSKERIRNALVPFGGGGRLRLRRGTTPSPRATTRRRFHAVRAREPRWPFSNFTPPVGGGTARSTFLGYHLRAKNSKNALPAPPTHPPNFSL